MIGLKLEIDKRKKGKHSTPNEKWAVKFIANLLGISHTAIIRKLKNAQFFVEESVAIFKTLVPPQQQTMELYLYLFTDQNKKGE